MHLGGQVDATIRSKNITFVKSAGKKATPQIHKHTGRLRAAQLYKQPGRFIYTNRIIVGLLCYLRFLGSEMKRCALDRKHALLENVWLLCCFVSLSVIDFLVACYER